ncbi:MAG TPA: hypothetical protein VG501_12440, partial [Rhizomicrobium sp.]|nr:hypothetical protein [Rhizomicrobium sp.]
HNIGFDGSGTHSEASSMWRVDVSAAPVTVGDIAIGHSPEAFEAFKRFNRKNAINSVWRRMKGRARKVLRRSGLA